MNPLLPALRADTPGLLRRAGGLLNAVRGIQQEASAEYWYGLLQNEILIEEQRRDIEFRCSELLRRDIKLKLKIFNQKVKHKKYIVYENYYDGHKEYDVDKFYRLEKELVDKIFADYQKLASLQHGPIVQARIMLDAAKSLESLVPYEEWAVYISCAFAYDKQKTTLLKKLGRGDFVEVFSEIINNFPCHTETYLQRAEEYTIKKEYFKSLKDLNKYIHYIQDNAAAYKLRGRVRNLLGDVAGMVEDAIAAERLGAVLEKGWLAPPTELPF